MKTRLLIIIVISIIVTIVLPANAQYMGNPYVGNHTSHGPFPTEPLSLETLDEIKKIIISDDAFQHLVDGKPFSFYDGNAYTGSTGTEEWDQVIMINVNNETSVSVLFSLQEKKILKIDSYAIYTTGPVIVTPTTSEMSDIDTEPGTIEEKLQIAKMPLIQESAKAGSSGPLLDRSAYLVTPIIVGIVIGVGSFFGLMIYWRKRK